MKCWTWRRAEREVRKREKENIKIVHLQMARCLDNIKVSTMSARAVVEVCQQTDLFLSLFSPGGAVAS